MATIARERGVKAARTITTPRRDNCAGSMRSDCHAGHARLDALDLKLLPTHAGLAAKLSLPHPVTDHHAFIQRWEVQQLGNLRRRGRYRHDQRSARKCNGFLRFANSAERFKEFGVALEREITPVADRADRIVRAPLK